MMPDCASAFYNPATIYVVVFSRRVPLCGKASKRRCSEPYSKLR